eukprot:902810-Amorphochlora_amoeboformis.AAC.1
MSTGWFIGIREVLKIIISAPGRDQGVTRCTVTLRIPWVPTGTRVLKKKMAEAPPVSVNEKKFIENALRKGIRVDGRKALTMRKLQIQFGRKAGTVEVSLGKTRVFSACSADVVKPYPVRKNKTYTLVAGFVGGLDYSQD